MMSDVSAPRLVESTYALVQELIAELSNPKKTLGYFDTNILQLLLTALLKPSLVAIFNLREGSKGTKKELSGGTKYFSNFIQALNTSASITYCSEDDATAAPISGLEPVSCFSPRLCVLRSLVETDGFHFMAGLSLDNKKALFMHFIDILLESSYTSPVPPTSEHNIAQVEEGSYSSARALGSKNFSPLLMAAS